MKSARSCFFSFRKQKKKSHKTIIMMIINPPLSLDLTVTGDGCHLSISVALLHMHSLIQFTEGVNFTFY